MHDFLHADAAFVTVAGHFLPIGLNALVALPNFAKSCSGHYDWLQERAPALLRNNNGELHLSWIVNANKPYNLRRLGMTRDEFNALVRGWPASEQGRRLLEGLRWAGVATSPCIANQVNALPTACSLLLLARCWCGAACCLPLLNGQLAPAHNSCCSHWSAALPSLKHS